MQKPEEGSLRNRNCYVLSNEFQQNGSCFRHTLYQQLSPVTPGADLLVVCTVLLSYSNTCCVQNFSEVTTPQMAYIVASSLESYNIHHCGDPVQHIGTFIP
jgi:hypothetical protein